MQMDIKALSRSQLGVLAAFGLVAVMLAVAILFIAPMRKRGAKMSGELDSLVRRNNEALENVKRVKELEQLSVVLAEKLSIETNKYLLRPVLGSYPVQRDIYRIAAAAGFRIGTVRMVGRTPEPQKETIVMKKGAAKGKVGDKKGAKGKAGAKVEPHFARYNAIVEGEGSYASIVELIGMLEEENPYCGVTAFNISANPRNVERHIVKISLEWPVEAE